MSHLPHSLKVDGKVKDDYYKNFDAYNMKGLNQADDYICVFENNGQLIPDIGLGLNFRMANSKKEKKDVCENKFRGGGSEPGMYLRKDDWISSEDTLQCAAYNLKDDLRATYEVNSEPKSFPSKKLCDKYKNKGEHDIYTRMIPKDSDQSTLDLRKKKIEDEKIKDSKEKIMWITYIIIVIFHLLWITKFHIKKPYEFFDMLNNTIISKSLYIILLFGVFLYLFCPFDTCYHKSDTPLYRKNFSLVLKRDFCNYLNNTTELEMKVCQRYDNSRYIKLLTPVINLIFTLNKALTNPFKSIYSSMCTPCSIEYGCIDRSPKYSVGIRSPILIKVYENDMRKVINKTNTNK